MTCRHTGSLTWTTSLFLLLVAIARALLRAAQVGILGKVGFLISPKSVLEPVRTLEFNGKQLAPAAMAVENKLGVIGGIAALWLLGIAQNRLSGRMAAGLLGKLEWAVRTNAGMALFVAGGHCWKLNDCCYFRTGIRRARMTAIAFALTPQSFAFWPWLPQLPSAECFFFSDAAERSVKGRYRIGVVRGGRRWRSRKAPKWVTTLQQADLYAAVFALRLGCYMRLPYVVAATDSDVCRAQILGLRGGIFLRGQQRLLRRLLWLRSWNDRPLRGFRVGTELNPADPPGRLGSFRTQSDVTDNVKRRQVAWKGESNRFVCLEFLPRFAWRLR